LASADVDAMGRRAGMRRGPAAELPAGSGPAMDGSRLGADRGRRAYAGAGPGGGDRADPIPPGVPQPMSPRVRRAADRVGRSGGGRGADDGLFDASAVYRPAPEDDDRGYLRRVQVEVIDSEEVYRLYDPSRERSTARSTW
jgi:hypothetical protein